MQLILRVSRVFPKQAVALGMVPTRMFQYNQIGISSLNCKIASFSAFRDSYKKPFADWRLQLKEIIIEIYNLRTLVLLPQLF